MAERKRSEHAGRETDRILGKEGSVSQQGSAGGTLPRDVGSEDELKRAEERPAGRTRVTKSKEKGDDDER